MMRTVTQNNCIESPVELKRIVLAYSKSEATRPSSLAPWSMEKKALISELRNRLTGIRFVQQSALSSNSDEEFFASYTTCAQCHIPLFVDANYVIKASRNEGEFLLFVARAVEAHHCPAPPRPVPPPD